jgi:hypothetical protein
MVVVSLLCTALLQVSTLSTVPGDTLSRDTVSSPAAVPGATSAPADSASVAWYRQPPASDARLVPDWSRALSADTVPRRRRAVEYSDEYYSRLQLHRWGSWLEFPVFGTEYWLGQKLMSRDETPAGWVKPTHVVVAGTLGGLFALNTITGVWNLYESRNDTDQRALVWTHSALMLASDAGFVITAMLAGDAEDSFQSRDRHRNAALVSMGIGGVGTLIMWLKRGF